MLYHYKRPGDWLWTARDTVSLAGDVASGHLKHDWRYRVDGDPQVHTLADLLEKEHARALKYGAHRTEAEEALLAPDGTWGVITVIICCAVLAFVLFVPARPGGSPSSKWFVVAIALTWMGRGIALISAARDWKKRSSDQKGLTRRCS
jgi:hypothetical protein